MNAKRMKATLLTAILILSMLSVMQIMPVSALVEEPTATITEGYKGYGGDLFAFTDILDVEYSLATTAGGVNNDPVEIGVTDDGTSVTWTIDFPDQVGNGLKHVALIIALEGDGEGPAYQIHNTDNTEFTLTDGTPLVPGTWVVSPYYDDAWHSNDINTLVTALDWVTCSGERHSADGLYTISIDKSELGNDFHWALSLAIGSGGELIYEAMSCPDGIGDWYNWGNPEVDMAIPNYEHAQIGYFGWDPLTMTMAVSDDILQITVVTPEEIDETPENFGMPFDTDCDGVIDWQIQYHADPESEDREFPWAFSELIDGTYTKDIDAPPRKWSPLPDWITGVTSDFKTFTITIDLETADIDFPIKFGIFMAVGAGHIPGPPHWSGGTAIILFPDPGFDWFDSTDIATLGVHNQDSNILYPTIQDAIDAANSDDTILVYPGTYDETVLLNNDITLVGEEGAYPIIEGGVHITSSDVTLTGFKINPSLILGEVAGVYLGTTLSNVEVSYNEIFGTFTSGERGVILTTSGSYTNVRITNNLIHDLWTGIYTNPHDGTVIIEYNEIYNCWAGIGGATGASVKYNHFYDNVEAMGVDDSLIDLTVMHNNFEDPVNNYGSVPLVAEYNYWETGDPLVIADTMINQQGPDIGEIDFDPWFGGESVSEQITLDPEEESTTGTFDVTEEADTEVEYTATADTTISVSTFEENPEQGFSNEAGKYYDVYVEEPTAVESLTLKFYYTDAELGGKVETTLSMLWYDSVTSAWIPCSDQTLYTSCDDPKYSGYIEVYVAATGTNPCLADLSGTPLGIEGEWPEVAEELCDLSVSGDVIVEAAEDVTYIYASMGDTAEITVEMDLAGYHGDIYFTLYKKVDGGLAYVDEIRTVYGIELKGSRTANWVVDQNPGNYVVWINIDLMEKVQLTGLDEALHIGPIEVIIS